MRCEVRIGVPPRHVSDTETQLELSLRTRPCQAASHTHDVHVHCVQADVLNPIRLDPSLSEAVPTGDPRQKEKA